MQLLDIKNTIRKQPALYHALIFLSRTIYLYGISAQHAVRIAFPDTTHGRVILNMGSGSSPRVPGIQNVDIEKNAHVDVVADAAHLPFADRSVDMIISECLLEHVPDPRLVADEFQRVLKSGGYLYLMLPFVYPYHAAPRDFTRFTIEGLQEIFHELEVIKSGARSGPIAALVVQLAYVCAMLLSFRSRTLYALLLSFFLIALSPLKLLDYISLLFPVRDEAASQIFFFARKR